MSKFDHNEHKIIGVAKKVQDREYAKISVLGYFEALTHKFIPFSKDEIISIFKNNGVVHYPRPQERFCNTIIHFFVRENTDYEQSRNIDRFCVDYQGMENFERDIITTSKKERFTALEKYGYEKYYKMQSRLYKFEKQHIKKGVAKYWQLSDEFFKHNPNFFLLEDDIFSFGDEVSDINHKYGDLFTDEQIINYVIEITKQHNWDGSNLQTITDEMLQLLNIPKHILEFRFEKFSEIIETTTLTHEQINKLASQPLLYDALQRSIKEYEDEYIETYEYRHKGKISQLETEKEKVLKERQNELSQLELIHQKNIKEIQKTISAKNEELSQVISKIKKRTAELEDLESRYAYIDTHKDKLIEDFSVIRDVLGSNTNAAPIQSNLLDTAIQQNICQGVPIADLSEFVGQIRSILQTNNLDEDVASTIAKAFTGRHELGHNIDVLLFPTIKLVKVLLDTIGNYNLLSISTKPNWLSYSDLYNSGLCNIIESAQNHNTQVHILLLQNMNLAYMPAYMHPINDILNGITTKLPTKDGLIDFPANLWIIGTRTEEEAIPLSLEAIEMYGCIERKDYYSEIEDTDKTSQKFITMEVINEIRQEERSYKSYPDSYLD